MKLLSLNSRGLQKAMALTALVDIQSFHDADVIFLMGTHLREWSVECLRRHLKMDYKEVLKVMEALTNLGHDHPSLYLGIGRP
jgi:hypothetical protein